MSGSIKKLAKTTAPKAPAHGTKGRDSRLLVDMRCPACNERVRGTQDVGIYSSLPVVAECRHCGTPVRFVQSCPACNAPVLGTQDVMTYSAVAECRHCRTPARFVQSFGFLGHYYLVRNAKRKKP